MLRREIIKGLAVSPIAFGSNNPNRLEVAVAELKAALQVELRQPTEIKVRYDPKNTKVPFMFVAFKG